MSLHLPSKPSPHVSAIPSSAYHMIHRTASVRERLDRVLVTRGLAESREQASRLILAGAVKVDGMLADKQARLVSAGAKIAEGGSVRQPWRRKTGRGA